MKQPNAWAAKGAVVEEWIDLHFFRPVGFLVAGPAASTRISPDHLTVVGLVIGLAAGHLFFYENRWLNALGFVLFIVSDIFDSADGQLARLRGTSTRFGRVLDGISDNLRFINLYLTLLVRLKMAGWGWVILGLTALAGVSHSLQSAAADFIRQAYLFLGSGGGELELLDEVEEPTGSPWHRFGIGLYRDYLRNQGRLFPSTTALVRHLRRTGTVSEEFREAYQRTQAGTVRHCAWIGQNIRFLLIGVTAVLGWPSGFFWLTVIPLNLALFALTRVQERNSRLLGAHFNAPVTSHAHVA